MGIRRACWRPAAGALALLGLAVAIGAGCGGGGGDGAPAGPTLNVTSNDITDGAPLDPAHAYNQNGCTGNNLLPVLYWAWSPEAPADLQSCAITCLDETVPWVHYVAYNIPPSTTDMSGSFPPGASIGPNSYGTTGYGGPCPPPGPAHTYVFQVWALDIADLTTAAGFDPNDPDAIVAAIQAHAIASGGIRVTYARP